MPETGSWLAPWYAVDASDTLEAQLRREISDRHVLYDVPVTLIARREDTDDALFQLPDGRVAEVHLTWRQSVETDPRWPATTLYASLDRWRAESMIPLRRWLDDTFGPDDQPAD
jgi:hypothetical protein